MNTFSETLPKWCVCMYALKRSHILVRFSYDISSYINTTSVFYLVYAKLVLSLFGLYVIFNVSGSCLALSSVFVISRLFLSIYVMLSSDEL